MVSDRILELIVAIGHGVDEEILAYGNRLRYQRPNVAGTWMVNLKTYSLKP